MNPLPQHEASSLIAALLHTISDRLVPLTQRGVDSGSKVFAAAVLSRSTLEPLSVATNNERASPLLHGEIACIQAFFTVDFPDPSARPDTGRDCIFLATHEPCSLCLSGIAWSGFREFYYLFTHEDSRDVFSIPHDIDILTQVFRVRGSQESDEQLGKRALYNKTNRFFSGRAVGELLDGLPCEADRERWRREIRRVKDLYNGLSETYQARMRSGAESSSVWR
ncbi:cytidine/deoxycytidylate deaminase family protein [Moelleriella libera RCEF 2490]|uniref:Cytidine/deoxycytidylate deaminase family protein n=1 Tax=Moelleriella libera RCEF 2490 TaxID=1081109 RepID=A0A168F3F9_9HYPO|nr:cytidine/deoxycytidylate deaminase family protein [Moelleriella libera RCEF 2490]